MHLQKSVVSCGAVSPRLPRARARCTRSIRTALRSYLGRTDLCRLVTAARPDAISTSAGVSRPNMLTLSFTLKLSVSMLLHKAHKAFQGAGGDLHGVADVEVDGQRSRLLHAHLLHFLSGQGDRLRGRADEAGAAARIAHDIPGIVVHHHLDQNVAGEQLVLHHTAPCRPCQSRGPSRTGTLMSQIRSCRRRFSTMVCRSVRHLVLVAGIGMHDIPKRLIGLLFHSGLTLRFKMILRRR